MLEAAIVIKIHEWLKSTFFSDSKNVFFREESKSNTPQLN